MVFECIDRIDKNLNELGKELIKKKVAKITQETLKKSKQETPIKIIKQEILINIKKEPLDEMDTVDEVEIVSFDSEFLSNFPMTELDDIINLEVRLVNCPEFKEKFVSI